MIKHVLTEDLEIMPLIYNNHTTREGDTNTHTHTMTFSLQPSSTKLTHNSLVDQGILWKKPVKGVTQQDRTKWLGNKMGKKMLKISCMATTESREDAPFIILTNLRQKERLISRLGCGMRTQNVSLILPCKRKRFPRSC